LVSRRGVWHADCALRDMTSSSTSHSTSGTDRRASHTLSGQLLFRFTDEMQELREDLNRASGQRSAKTLAKSGGLRVTMVQLEANNTIDPESNNGAATIQVIEGRLRISTDGTVQELGPGELMVLDHNLNDPIQAAERTTFLVTVAFPEGAGAWEEEQAQARH